MKDTIIFHHEDIRGTLRLEGFRAVLIERGAEYAADIRRRFGLPAEAEEFPEDILDILGPLNDFRQQRRVR